MLNASPCVRKEMVKEVEILGDHKQSGYDKIHGEDGKYQRDGRITTKSRVRRPPGAKSLNDRYLVKWRKFGSARDVRLAHCLVIYI